MYHCDEFGNQEVPTESSICGANIQRRNESENKETKVLLDGPSLVLQHNWQASCSSVKERNALLFNNDYMADIYFRVGEGDSSKRIPAHKYVLATGSSVFYAMFYGTYSSPDTDSKEINIPDVEPVAFLSLLRYLYCDIVKVEADTVLATLYAAKKYIIPHLASQCVRYLETSLDAKNACLLLSQSRLFEEENLTNRCWEVIDAQTEEALHSDSFLEIDHDTLLTIFSRETLNIKNELSLLEAAIRWADEECIRCYIPLTNENRRAKIGSALYKIRFPAMRLQDFADGPAQSSILSSVEICDLFLHFTSQRKPQLPFPTKPRKGLQPLRCHRFQSCAYRSNQWRYRGRCDSIQFTVDSRIFLVGFGLYGSSNGTAEYKVALELKKHGHVLAKNNVKIFTDGSNNTFPVLFEHPCLIEPSTVHMASVVIDGAELSYFGQEGLSEATEAGITFQFVCSPDSTNGTGVQGGQIPEFIFYR